MKTGETFKDIYSKTGVLLLAKGQKITGDYLAKLHQSDYIEKSVYEELRTQLALSNCKERMSAKFAYLNDAVTDSSNEMVSQMLFSSREKTWWRYVSALSNYVDWVYEHSIDVALISLIIANRMNLPKQEQTHLCAGAFLHDIGKILIPKKIIQKPGSLTAQEMLIVKRHCELGRDLLEDSDLPDGCLDMALQHHERLDGSGYPFGITSNKISDYAKIVMVADVLDAITSYRPYKKQIGTIDFALRELKNGKEQFDQRIVDLLFNIGKA